MAMAFQEASNVYQSNRCGIAWFFGWLFFFFLLLHFYFFWVSYIVSTLIIEDVSKSSQ